MNKSFIPFALVFSVSAHNIDTSVKLDEEVVKTAPEPKPKPKPDRNNNRTFAGLNFGVGVALTLDSGERSRVAKASIVNGFVRVDERQDEKAHVLLESHFFFTPQEHFLGLKTLPSGSWGIGPFVSIQPGTDDCFDGLILLVLLAPKIKKVGTSE